MQSIPLVKEFIAASIAEFNDWSKEMIVSPTINKLKNALEQIRQFRRHAGVAGRNVREQEREILV